LIETKDHYLATAAPTASTRDLAPTASPVVDYADSEPSGDGNRPLAFKRATVYRLALACADLLAAGVATLLVWKTMAAGHSPLILLAIPAIVLLGKIIGTYDRRDVLLRKATLDEAPTLFQLATLYTLIVWVISGAVVPGAPDRLTWLVVWPILFSLLVLFRAGAHRLARSFTPSERCLVVGDERQCEWLQLGLERQRAVHATVIAHAVPADRTTTESEPVALLSTDWMPPLVRRFSIDRIIIVPGAADDDGVATIIDAATSLGLKVSVVANALRLVGASAEFGDLQGVPLLSVGPRRLSRPSQVLKRALDVAGSAIGLLLLAPFLTAIALIIKLDSTGPAFFRQRRIGRHGASFEMVKFRTMVADAEQQKHALHHLNQRDGLFKIAEDPRVTRIGRWLRRTAVDELPQLLNVLRGEMSLVGPRPLVNEEDKRIEGWRRRRLQLTPGMTGNWQILGSTRVSLDELVEIDYLYVTNWSLWLDLKILLRTIPFVVNGRGL